MRKFFSEVWQEMKRNFVMYMVMLVIGYGYGKMFAYSSVLADCRVMGMFRLNDIAVSCRTSETR